MSVTIAWPDGKTDVVVINRSGTPVTCTVAGDPAPQALPSERSAESPRRLAASPSEGGVPVIETDADKALVRFEGGLPKRYLLHDVSTFTVDGTDYVTIHDGTATVGFSGTRIDIDRYDADFSIYAPGVTEMFCRGQRIYLVESDGVLTRDPLTAIRDGPVPAPALRTHAFPNPFTAATTISLETDAPGVVSAVLYDAKGRRVRTIWNGPLPAGRHTFLWKGEDESGARASSGVYFLKATSGSRTTAAKVVLLR